MKIQFALYNPDVFVGRVKKNPDLNSIERLIREYLERGAHTHFVQEMTKLASFDFPEVYSEGMNNLCASIIAQDYKIRQIPEIQDRGLLAPLSRLFSDERLPRNDIEEGLFHGVLIEMLNVVWGLCFSNRAEDAARIWRNDTFLVLIALTHPNANVAVLKTFIFASSSITAMLLRQQVISEDEVDKEKGYIYHQVAIEEFLVKQVKQKGLRQVFLEILDTWNDLDISIFWEMVENILLNISSFDELAATLILQTLLEASSNGSPVQSMAAKEFLFKHPIALDRRGLPPRDEDKMLVQTFVSICYPMFIVGLGEELPELKTRQALIHWLKRSPFKIRMSILIRITFSPKDDKWSINEKAEFLVEEVFGAEAWKAICAFQDPSFWKKKERGDGYEYRGAIDTTRREYSVIEKVLKKSPLNKHIPAIAEGFEDLIHGAISSVDGTREMLVQNLTLLSGDLILTVTHLRTQWMQVRRRQKELLGREIPRIEIAQHPRLGDSGAACRFKLIVPGLPKQLLRGLMGSDGELTLQNTPYLDSLSRLALQALITQTLCVILIPRYIDEAPDQQQHGARFITGSELYATRPLIHRIGKLPGPSRSRGVNSGGSKIHPVIADCLFRWLLDEIVDHPFRLLVIGEEQVGRKQEKFYFTARDAKERLLAKSISLNDVFIRIVRAHTRPLLAYLDESDEVQTQKMSEYAVRNYQRYLNDVGRVLDFTPVLKTYVLPDGRRVPVEVPRTFIQGAFASLRDVLTMVMDDGLKAQVSENFLVE